MLLVGRDLKLVKTFLKGYRHQEGCGDTMMEQFWIIFSRMILPLGVTLLQFRRRAGDWMKQQRHPLRASVTPQTFPACNG